MAASGSSRPAEGPAPRRRARLIWSVTGAGVVTSAVLLTLLVRGLSAPPHHLSFLLVAGLFAAAEVAIVRVEVGSRPHTYSLIEVPLVLGLLTMRPWMFVVAWLLGGFTALGVIRRQPAPKVAYNLSAFALQSVVAVLVFHWIAGGGRLLAGRTIAGVLIAVLVTCLLSVSSVFVAVYLAEGGQPGEERVRYLLSSLAASGATTSTVLIGVVLEQTDPVGLWLLVVPVGGAYLAQRALLGPGGWLRRRRGAPGQQSRRSAAGPTLPGQVTGSADGATLVDHMARLLGERGDSHIACFLIDLGDVGDVAARYGDATAEHLVAVSTQRLARCLRAGDLAARSAGDGLDGLAVLAHVSPDDAVAEATALGRRIIDSLGRPASLGERTVTTRVTAGVAIARRGQAAAGVLVSAATALGRARATGPGQVEVEPAAPEPGGRDAWTPDKERPTTSAEGQALRRR